MKSSTLRIYALLSAPLLSLICHAGADCIRISSVKADFQNSVQNIRIDANNGEFPSLLNLSDKKKRPTDSCYAGYLNDNAEGTCWSKSGTGVSNYEPMFAIRVFSPNESRSTLNEYRKKFVLEILATGQEDVILFQCRPDRK